MKNSNLFAGFLCGLLVSACGDASELSLTYAAENTVARSNGPLRVNPKNPRYFVDASGEPVYMVGSHTWDSLQDWGGSYSDFNYTAYLDLLEANQHNFIRLWTMEGTSNGADNRSTNRTPMQWQRSGSRFDLERFNSAFFDRLRARVQAAGQRGIYVGVMLFQGWSVKDSSLRGVNYRPWADHPFNAQNNVNGVDGDSDNDGEGNELHALGNTRILSLQKRYVERVIDAVGDLDNVLYEVANESNGTLAWQEAIVSHIRWYQASRPTQHPIGITSSGTNAERLRSNADWVSLNKGTAPLDYVDGFPMATGAKVVLLDTDHLPGILVSSSVEANRRWVWKSFVSGYNPIVMDGIQNPWPGADGFTAPGNPGTTSAIKYMGQTQSYARRYDLTQMVPSPNLCSSGYCLADPGQAYLAYQPSRGADISVNLQSGVWAYEWFNPKTGTIADSGTVSVGSGFKNFSCPFNDDGVLFIESSALPEVSRIEFGDGGTEKTINLDDSERVFVNVFGSNMEASTGEVKVIGLRGAEHSVIQKRSRPRKLRVKLLVGAALTGTHSVRLRIRGVRTPPLLLTIVAPNQVGDHVSINFGPNDGSEGLSRPSPEPGNGITAVESVFNPCTGNSIKMRTPVDGSKNIYLDVGKGFIHDGSWPSVEVQVSYWDHGNGWFRLRYDALDGTAKSAGVLNFGDSDCVGTAVFVIDDALFANGIKGAADLRFVTGAGASRARVNKVTVTKR